MKTAKKNPNCSFYRAKNNLYQNKEQQKVTPVFAIEKYKVEKFAQLDDNAH